MSLRQLRGSLDLLMQMLAWQVGLALSISCHLATLATRTVAGAGAGAATVAVAAAAGAASAVYVTAAAADDGIFWASFTKTSPLAWPSVSWQQ